MSLNIKSISFSSASKLRLSYSSVLIAFILLIISSCNRKMYKSRWTKEKAPSTFEVRFETSKGPVDIRVNREWSPLAADRFYQLVKHKFYDSAIFYRVVPNFVAQFGATDTVVINKWMKHKIADEPVSTSNKKGTISWARSGKETRGRELFINLVDNPRLDTVMANGVKGYPPFGEVISGMENVSALNNEFGNRTMSHLNLLYKNRDSFNLKFPGIDYIRKAYLIKKKGN
ncbi:MAG: peptidylprolyl isomerase [Flavitalea sp.]